MEQAIVRYRGGGRCAIVRVSLVRFQRRPVSETLSTHSPPTTVHLQSRPHHSDPGREGNTYDVMADCVASRS